MAGPDFWGLLGLGLKLCRGGGWVCPHTLSPTSSWRPLRRRPRPWAGIYFLCCCILRVLQEPNECLCYQYDTTAPGTCVLFLSCLCSVDFLSGRTMIITVVYYPSIFFVLV